jgi:predicted nucleic acid-binding protein
VTLFVDTSVWSLAFRRDTPPEIAETAALARAISDGAQVMTTGLVLQEVLQGMAGPKQRATLIERFSSLTFLIPDKDDHIEAAGLRNACRSAGVQVGTVDALLAQLCIRHGLTMLTTDQDFRYMVRHVPLRLWPPRPH